MTRPTPKQPVDWSIGDRIDNAIVKAHGDDKTGQSHGALSSIIRTINQDVRAVSFERSTSGIVSSRYISGTTDKILKSLFKITAGNNKDQPVCLIAVGGYGRATLSPHSDIDLLLLHSSARQKNMTALTDGLFYPLWDGGLTLGQGVHTISSAMTLAKSDITACTSYLDARMITGDNQLFEQFIERFNKYRLRTIKSFVTAKLEEQDSRHEAFEQSRFLTEPDLKEGKGGLRDVETIGWIHRYAYGEQITPGEASPLLQPDDIKALRKAHRFLLKTRNHLHALRGHGDNRLSFDVQNQLALRLGYTDRTSMSAGERLMRHYFITARDIGRLMRIFCARLEAANSKKLVTPSKALPKALEKDGLSSKPNLALKSGRLTFAKPSLAQHKPVSWFRLLYAFTRQSKIDIHPDALALMAHNVKIIDRETRKDPDLTLLFRKIILDAKDPARTLRLMIETGILSKFIPALGRIVGRITFGLYRRFTLDEQTVRAVDFLNNMRRGNETKLHPLSSKIAANAHDIYPYFLAVLFHEAHQGNNADIHKTEKNLTRVCRRLGLDHQTAKDVAWAAVNRHLLVNTVDRRTISDPDAIRQFCNRVVTRDRLDLLVVVSVCYQHVVGTPGTDERLHRKMRVLFQSAAVYLEKGEAGLEKHLDARVKTSRSQVVRKLGDWREDDIDWVFSKLRNTAIHAVEPALLGRFAPLLRSADTQGLDAAVSASLRDDGSIEAIIYAEDRSGLLTDLAGAISALSLSMRSVQAITTLDHKVIDIFVIQSVDGVPLEDPEQAKRVHRALLETARTPPKDPPKLPRRLGDRRLMFDVKSEVIIDLEASQTCVVVEAVGLDRPGLLYKLTRALVEIGVIIRTAHVATYGERAVDSFYLQDAPGYKITNTRRLQSIERRLLNVLTITPDGDN